MTGKLSRRDFIKTTMVGAGTFAGISALSPDGFLAHASPSVNRGGVWKVASAHTPPTLDAHRISMYWASVGGMYNCLISTRVDPKTHSLQLIPGLATEWQIEKEGSRIVFNLRKGIRFHDNSKFNAGVAKWNLDRVRSHPKSYLKSDLQEVDSVDVLNDYSIALNLKYPSASLLYNLSDGRLWGAMVSKAFQEKHGDDELARKGCGTGPFRYKNWIVDQKVILERNPDYWLNGVDGKPLPYLDGLEEHYRPQIDKAVVDLRAGGLDTVIDPAARDFPAIDKNPNLAYMKLPPFEYMKICIGFNARSGPFTSHALRQAACYAIDRQRVAKIMGFGVARVHQYPWISKGQPGWAPDEWPDYSFNPEKAKELLKVDYPKGVTVELFNISREPDNTFAELIKAMWDKVGIKTEMKSLERLGWIEAMRKDTFQAGFWSAATYMGAFLRPKLLSGARGNWGQMKNPKVDGLLEKHVKTVDLAKRHEIMKEILKIVYESAELTSSYAITQAVGTNKKVKGLRTYWRYLAAEDVWLEA